MAPIGQMMLVSHWFYLSSSVVHIVPMVLDAVWPEDPENPISEGDGGEEDVHINDVEEALPSHLDAVAVFVENVADAHEVLDKKVDTTHQKHKVVDVEADKAQTRLEKAKSTLQRKMNRSPSPKESPQVAEHASTYPPAGALGAGDV